MPRHKQSDPTSIKSQVIRLRVTEAEAKKFKKKAAEAGCKSISDAAMRCSCYLREFRRSRAQFRFQVND